MVILSHRNMLGGLCASRGVRGHAPPQENFVDFKVKCINLVLSERSKLAHELLVVEQRKSIDLNQDNKEGSNIFLVMRVLVCITALHY